MARTPRTAQIKAQMTEQEEEARRLQGAHVTRARTRSQKAQAVGRVQQDEVAGADTEDEKGDAEDAKVVDADDGNAVSSAKEEGGAAEGEEDVSGDEDGEGNDLQEDDEDEGGSNTEEKEGDGAHEKEVVSI
ncbi:hypothetical protein JG688_00005422 [Phytophthora aleatoria]|uniref:Uncharacterized protein n=1 Tax=Phytophthora aleatoria TaxID=2496075 RepID=A0A8J5JD16_9STRA|nr:hypothetical protein JG688_00005422 [Phytophthora aleatoria]